MEWRLLAGIVAYTAGVGWKVVAGIIASGALIITLYGVYRLVRHLRLRYATVKQAYERLNNPNRQRIESTSYTSNTLHSVVMGAGGDESGSYS